MTSHPADLISPSQTLPSSGTQISRNFPGWCWQILKQARKQETIYCISSEMFPFNFARQSNYLIGKSASSSCSKSFPTQTFFRFLSRQNNCIRNKVQFGGKRKHLTVGHPAAIWQSSYQNHCLGNCIISALDEPLMPASQLFNIHKWNPKSPNQCKAP